MVLGRARLQLCRPEPPWTRLEPLGERRPDPRKPFFLKHALASCNISIQYLRRSFVYTSRWTRR
jgi:hypothetical protein